jgi:hypothetical protein
VAHIGQELALGPAGGFGAGEGLAQGLGLGLHLGDVDAQADDAAVGGPPLLDHQPAPVRQALLVALAGGGAELGQPLGQPFLLAPDRLGIVAPRHADAQGVGQPDPRAEQIGGAVVHLRIALVPQDVAALIVQEDHAFRDGLDGVAQAVARQPGLGFGLGEGVRAQPPGDRRGPGLKRLSEQDPPPPATRPWRVGPTI